MWRIYLVVGLKFMLPWSFATTLALLANVTRTGAIDALHSLLNKFAVIYKTLSNQLSKPNYMSISYNLVSMAQSNSKVFALGLL